ncbi:uncharacterized protein LOC114517651 [Dendronephthya gigantea]|uniref:uncharacterized protein LOC114517651 n=1 Tax=Dendronephthya gigantea TaxID=151771 RepID=UPI00106DA41D|nr:uncharacterized protein LOC114517651 [Dendronephthya gigantea]
MGNMCSFTGSRPSNRILPTNSTVLALGLGNKDLALYRRHRKKDEGELGLAKKSGSSSKAAVTKQSNDREGRTDDNLQDYTSNLEPDREMQEWLDSIIFQNNLLPSFMTFDNKRHLSMRSKYTDARQTMKLRNAIDESHEEHQNNTLPSSGRVKSLKKNAKQKITKILSHETFNLGLGPSPVMSTRISKDAVKRNKGKNNLKGFHGGRKTPAPPKPKSASLNPSIASTPNSSKSKGRYL